jgi:hypothetical protein
VSIGGKLVGTHLDNELPKGERFAQSISSLKGILIDLCYLFLLIQFTPKRNASVKPPTLICMNGNTNRCYSDLIRLKMRLIDTERLLYS